MALKEAVLLDTESWTWESSEDQNSRSARRFALGDDFMIRAVLCINTNSCSEEAASTLRLTDGVIEVYSSLGALM